MKILKKEIGMAFYQESEWRYYHIAKQNRDNEAYWDKRAQGFSRHSGISNYTHEFIGLCCISPGWTVLDVGCGSGSLTIEIARKAKQVTGIDISGSMLTLLQKHAEVSGVENISAIKAAWEDDWDSRGIPAADLVMASRALLTPDLPAALKKLNERARERVCLTTVCGDLSYNDRKVVEAIGRTMPTPPDYIHVVNCLYDMDIKADVRFISSVKHDSYCHRDAAKSSLVKMLGSDLDAEEDRLLELFLDNHLVQSKNGLWIKDYERRTDWAFISWNSHSRQ